jgi:hypothetical protein
MAIDRPRPDVAKLLGIWKEWEKGGIAPGRVLADLKIAGMPDFLQSAVDATQDLP